MTVASTSTVLPISQRADKDIYHRSLPMLPAFIVLWSAITWFSGFYSDNQQFARIAAVAFGGVFVAQILFGLIQQKLYQAAKGAWRFIFYLLAFANAIVWSALFTLCFFQQGFEELFLPMTLATAAITNTALSNFAPSRWVAQTYTSVMLLPAAFVCFNKAEYVTMGGMVIAYWFYALFVLQRFHSEYMGSFEQESSFEQQHTELQRENRTDGLTKVFNRRYFDEALEREWQQGAQDQRWLALLFIDIDFFKKINDTYGHMAGDECLIQAASIINGAVQSGNDIVARYGGEEFAVLLPDTKPEMAERIAESIRRQFSLKEFCFEETCIAITASIGVSSMIPKLTASPSVLIDQADQGVYMAKEAGRNNVQLFGARH